MRKTNNKWANQKRPFKSQASQQKFHQCIYTMDWNTLLWKCQGPKGCNNYRTGQKKEENIKQLREWGFDE